MLTRKSEILKGTILYLCRHRNASSKSLNLEESSKIKINLRRVAIYYLQTIDLLAAEAKAIFTEVLMA